MSRNDDVTFYLDKTCGYEFQNSLQWIYCNQKHKCISNDQVNWWIFYPNAEKTWVKRREGILNNYETDCIIERGTTESICSDLYSWRNTRSWAGVSQQHLGKRSVFRKETFLGRRKFADALIGVIEISQSRRVSTSWNSIQVHDKFWQDESLVTLISSS